ncbi:MAG: Hpt domain-containing protein, partial [Lachnospiraceae bacterium]|nr:Hpt domain-containing protein [Lachnospiraceae bacterium]
FALQTYAESVEDKAAALEEALKEERTDDYVLIVHSLKSMSKSIGAQRLYEQAKALEEAGREGRTDTINEGTEAFVSEYRALGAKLSKELL